MTSKSLFFKLMKEDIEEFGLPDLDLYNDLCAYVVKTSSAEDFKNIFDVFYVLCFLLICLYLCFKF